jgi:hypothetical protein
VNDRIAVPRTAGRHDAIMHQTRSQKVKKFFLATAAVLALASPALACHGHDTPDGHWDINLDSWSKSEWSEMMRLAERVELITHRPAGANGNRPSATMASFVDQLECKEHMTHEGAIEQVIDLAQHMAQMQQQQ